jgi:hypothetical protein
VDPAANGAGRALRRRHQLAPRERGIVPAPAPGWWRLRREDPPAPAGTRQGRDCLRWFRGLGVPATPAAQVPAARRPGPCAGVTDGPCPSGVLPDPSWRLRRVLDPASADSWQGPTPDGRALRSPHPSVGWPMDLPSPRLGAVTADGWPHRPRRGLVWVGRAQGCSLPWMAGGARPGPYRPGSCPALAHRSPVPDPPEGCSGHRHRCASAGRNPLPAARAPRGPPSGLVRPPQRGGGRPGPACCSTPVACRARRWPVPPARPDQPSSTVTATRVAHGRCWPPRRPATAGRAELPLVHTGCRPPQ